MKPFSARLAMTLYRRLFQPFLITPLFILLMPFNRKIRDGFLLRLRFPKVKEGFTPKIRPIWIHCSSGEFEYAKPVIRELKQRYPNQPVIVTFFSPSYVDAILRFQEVDLVLPLPWDLPGPVFSFLKKFNPQMLLISRTDLWPEVIYQCHVRKIPTVLFAATAAENPNSLSGFTKSLFLHWIDHVYCVSGRDKEIFVNQGVAAGKIEIMGDTRYDQVFVRLEAPPRLSDLQPPAGAPVLICGSTWFEDERVLVDAVKNFVLDKKLQVVFVPHEPTSEHLGRLTELLTQKKLPFSVFSKTKKWSSGVLIFDQVGYLAELYKKGTLAFVGGSFRKSVHSVMEPLATGALTFVGPFYKNNREAVQFSEFRDVFPDPLRPVSVVRTAKEFEHMLWTYLDLKSSQILHLKTAKLCEDQKGASQKLVQKVNVTFSAGSP